MREEKPGGWTKKGQRGSKGSGSGKDDKKEEKNAGGGGGGREAAEEEKEKLVATIRKLNVKAEIIPTTFSRVDLGKVLNTKAFSMEEAATHWSQPLTWRTFCCALASTFTLNLLQARMRAGGGVPATGSWGGRGGVLLGGPRR